MERGSSRGVSRVGVVGGGVVGQATGIGFARLGHQVMFCDIDAGVVDRLRSRGYEAVFPQDMPRQRLDVTIICVDTPTVSGTISLSRLDAACGTVGHILQEPQGYHLVVVRSTLPPGTTEERVIPRLEARSGQRVGREFGVCYHPEFLRESSAAADFEQAWIKVYGGYDARSRRALRGLYGTNGGRNITEYETDIRTAEMVKYASNIYNATKISFTNEMWNACRQLDIDGNEVMDIVSQSAEGMWNPGYGIKGGFPYGGSCLPKDTLAFESFARDRDIAVPILQKVIEVNERMQRAARTQVVPRAAEPSGRLPAVASVSGS